MNLGKGLYFIIELSNLNDFGGTLFINNADPGFLEVGWHTL